MWTQSKNSGPSVQQSRFKRWINTSSTNATREEVEEHTARIEITTAVAAEVEEVTARDLTEVVEALQEAAEAEAARETAMLGGSHEQKDE